MKILITGTDGFLGKKLFNLLAKKYETFGITRKENRENIFSLDITDNKKANEIFNKIKPEILIHTAALVDVEKCEKEKELAFKVNTEATENIAKICKKPNIKMIYISTDYVFSGKEESYSIKSTPNPISYYGETKLLGEKAVQSLLNNYIIIRPTILYGFNSAEDKKNFVLNTINKLKNNEQVILDNKRIKYPLLIDDVAKTISKLIETNYQGIFHISGPDAVTKYEFGKKIARVFSLPEEKIIGENLKEQYRPYKVRFENQSIVKVLNLEQGLNLIKKQMREAKWK